MQDFEVVGIQDVATLERGITDHNRTLVDPSPQLRFQAINTHGTQVLVVEVLPLPAHLRPATTKGVAYLRQSDGDYPMTSPEIRMIELEKLHHAERRQYDLTLYPTLHIDDLDATLRSQCATNAAAGESRLAGLDEATILRRKGAIDAEGSPTLAGLYCLGDYPQGVLPALTVTAAVQLPGDHERVLKDKQDFSGPIPSLLEDVMHWVERNLATLRRYDVHGHMRDELELPLPAVRELAANALVHRDLSPDTLEVGRSIQIRLNNDHLFIQSPGGLRGITLAQLKSEQHEPVAVNQRVYHMAKLLRTSDGAAVIEGEGGSVTEVFAQMRRAGLERPLLIDTGTSFIAKLWRPDTKRADHPAPPAPATMPRPLPAPHNEQQHAGTGEKPSSKERRRGSNARAVFTALSNGPATLQKVVQATGLRSHQVRYVLNQAMRDTLVLRSGGQGVHGTTYSLTDLSQVP